MSSDATGQEGEILFEIAISSSSYLGTIFFIWGSISKSFAMEVDRDGIRASAVNESNTIHIEMVIPEEDLLFFQFNNISSDPSDKVVASFRSTELQSALPPSGKFVTTFIMFQNDFKKMYYIRSLSSSRKAMSNMSTITPYIRPNITYNVAEIPDKPICKILVSELVNAITSITKEGTPTTVFTMYVGGMRMHGAHPSGVEKGVTVFGDIDQEFETVTPTSESVQKLTQRLKKFGSSAATANGGTGGKRDEETGGKPKFVIQAKNENPHKIIIQTDCIRSLARLRTACPEGSIMSIYYEPNNPVILKCPAGVFGNLLFRIRSQK